MDARLGVLVVIGDEQERRRVAELVARSDADVVAACADGGTAVRTLASRAVDLVILDVRLPDVSAFDVVAAVGEARMPPTVMSADGPEFAARAFDAGALDYLQKPYTGARLGEALRRARGALAARGTAPRYPDAVAVRSGAQYVVVRVADLDWLRADGNHVRLYAGGKSRVVTKSLAAFERDVLDPALFVRVHRSAIVNVTRIATVEPLPHGELTLTLRDGSEVDCSRRYRKRLEERVYFTA